MAVYKRGYEPYSGRLTPEWSRFLVIARYAFRTLFDSKLLTAFFVVCFIGPLVGAAWIYLPHNATVAELLNPHRYLPIDNRFFFEFFRTQCIFGFLTTAFVGPGLISKDLANNALPLYFCRPFSRAEYIVGKMAVLGILLSAIIWVPMLALWLFQVGLVGLKWGADNFYIAWAIFTGAWLWILVLSLLALAVSAMVRWRIVAGAIVLGIFFVAAGFGAAINEALDTHFGDLLNIQAVMVRIFTDLFGLAARSELAVGTAWGAVAACCWACLMLLNRKVRAYEVVK